jgi:hypothetical protein
MVVTPIHGVGMPWINIYTCQSCHSTSVLPPISSAQHDPYGSCYDMMENVQRLITAKLIGYADNKFTQVAVHGHLLRFLLRPEVSRLERSRSLRCRRP